MLYGRYREQSVIDRLVANLRAGQSAALLVRGEPGIGKTAMLEHAEAAAAGIEVIRASGVEAEAELPFAGLHTLLSSGDPTAFDRIESVPAPQRSALRGAFGFAHADVGDRFLIGLAVFSLMSEVATDNPVLYLVDDAQWLDRASVEALVFAARRLGAEGVGIILAEREQGTIHDAGLPELPLSGIDRAAAMSLLSTQDDTLSPSTRARVISEAAGNPLALIELPRALTEGHGQMADALPLTGRLQETFLRQVRALPQACQVALLVSAAEGTGELTAIVRAAAAFEVKVRDLYPAERAGLVRLTQRRIEFRHPLVRSAVYQGAPVTLRISTHQALADALDAPADADRRVWHLAGAATGPDEEIARQLQNTAIRAAERRGYSAAAAAYATAAELSESETTRAPRLILAAEAALESGDLDRARKLADQAATAGDLEPGLASRLACVRGAADFGQGRMRSAAVHLRRGAETRAAHDPWAAAEILMKALYAAWHSGDREQVTAAAAAFDAIRLPDGDPLLPILEVARWTLSLAAGTAREPPLTDQSGHCLDLAPLVKRIRRPVPGAGFPDMLAFSFVVAARDREVCELGRILSESARAQGKLGWLPASLYYLAVGRWKLGQHREAEEAITEAARVAADTGQDQWLGKANGLLACMAVLVGDDERCRELAGEWISDGGTPRIPGITIAVLALARLDLENGRVEHALSLLETLTNGSLRFGAVALRSAIPEAVEAAARLGQPERAADALGSLATWASWVRQPSVDAVVARCRALLADKSCAERHYRSALTFHERDSRPLEHARTALLYGTWLRRAKRKAEARAQLLAALELFEALDAKRWADRCRCELAATGAAVPARVEAPYGTLTPQEGQIVRLAARGLSNKEIAAQLFLSPRTVGFHLYRAFPKLGITSRNQLVVVDFGR